MIDNDRKLDIIFGIMKDEEQPTEIVKTEKNVEIFQGQSDLKTELLITKQKLLKLSDMAEEVLEDSKTSAIEFGKSRDVEAFSSLLKGVVETQKAIVDINKTIDEKENSGSANSNEQKNGYVFIGDFRNLIDAINKKGEGDKDEKIERTDEADRKG